MPSTGHRDYRHPPQRKSMHARIVRDLGMRIVAGEFEPGARLPAEADLLAEYEVSRPVLREATRVLVAKGLVLSRQRAGATVRPRSEWHLLDPDVLYWLIQTQPPAVFVETLMTVRRVFEPAAAALAARIASDDALQGIAEATNNPLLAYIGNMLSLALRESIKLSSQLPNTHALSLPRHKAILTALLARDPFAAQQATLVQLKETREDLSEVLATGQGLL